MGTLLLLLWAWASSLSAQTPSMLDPTVTQVAGGIYHSCALTTVGGVKCWGYNGYGQLGNGATTTSSVQVDVSGLASGVVAIAAGGYHSCALTTAGGVKCWGWNGYGQLGNNSTTNSYTPIDVPGLGNGVAAITTGFGHTCALIATGGVKCWGYNGYGTLGNGTTTSSLVPVAVSGLAGAVAITAGLYHTCALTASGGANCWGYNYYGQLGNGTSSDSTVPVAVSGLTGGGAIKAGFYHTCALTTAGSVTCWGYNGHGQLGNNTTTDSAVPVAVSGLAGSVASIAAGGYHNCALTTTGATKCWGADSVGQLGNVSTTDSSVPVDVVGLSNAAASIAAGAYHTCAVTATGGAKCWGYNYYGQLGIALTTNRTWPFDVVGLAGGAAAVVATNSGHTCALTVAGGVKCWGHNFNGALGNGTTMNSSVPIDVVGLTNGVVAIAVAASNSCALTTAGGVKCWGYNGTGQLGNGTTTDSTLPIDVIGLTSGVVAIAAGDYHTCALTTAGGMKCWGFNYYGELGNGTTNNSYTPIDVPGLTSGVAAIAAGTYHTCARTGGNALMCWGLNYYGQLGNGTTIDSSVPVTVSGFTSGAAAIATGRYHTCALTIWSGASCWGQNFYGQLGNNTGTSSSVPVAVSGLSSGAAAIAAGNNFSCALRATTGGATCWGHNQTGQLGDGTSTDSFTPVAVSGLASGVAAITTGDFHACVRMPVDRVKCWGQNYNGELGNNTTTDSHVPVAILAGQSIVFAPPASLTVGSMATLSASAAGGGAVTFDTWTPGACTVSGTTLTITAPSLCGVRASQVGGSDGQGGTLAAAPQQLRLIQIQ